MTRSSPAGLREDRRPAADRPGPDHHEIRPVRHTLSSVVPVQGRTQAAPIRRARPASTQTATTPSRASRSKVERRRTVYDATSSPAARACATESRSSARHCAAIATAAEPERVSMSGAVSVWLLSQRGQAGARCAMPFERGHLERRHDRVRQPRPAAPASSSTTFGPRTSLSSTSRNGRRPTVDQDVRQRRHAERLEGGRAQRVDPLRVARGCARASRRDRSPGPRPTTPGRRTRDRRRPGSPARR